MARSRHADAQDEELLVASVEDPEAFGLFYDRVERDVLAFFWRATRRPELAADLTAEVFACALESAAAFRPELGSARAWLFGIARHELAETWRRGGVEDRARRRLAIEPLVLDDEALERIVRLDDGALDGSASRLLDELPIDQRDAVTGRVVQERDYAELARTLECSPSVVRQRVSRGLRAIRERLEQTR